MRTITIKLASGKTIIKRVDERGIVPDGGSTGEVLRKASDTDFDIEWGAGGGGGELTGEIVASVEVGGVDISDTFPVGTPLEDIIRAMLAPYVPPILNSLTIVLSPNNSIMEVGDEVNVAAASWTKTDDSDGNPPQDLHLTGDGFNTDVTTSPATASGTTVRTTAGVNTWTLAGYDSLSPQNAIASKSATKEWRFYFWFGGDPTSSLASNAEAQTLYDDLTQGKLLTSKSATFICDSLNDTAGNYTWACYPASWGALSNVIQNGALPVLTAFTYIGAFTVVNPQGISASYRFYKSNADQAFASGTTLLFS